MSALIGLLKNILKLGSVKIPSTKYNLQLYLKNQLSICFFQENIIVNNLQDSLIFLWFNFPKVS